MPKYTFFFYLKATRKPLQKLGLILFVILHVTTLYGG